MNARKYLFHLLRSFRNNHFEWIDICYKPFSESSPHLRYMKSENILGKGLEVIIICSFMLNASLIIKAVKMICKYLAKLCFILSN